MTKQQAVREPDGLSSALVADAMDTRGFRVQCLGADIVALAGEGRIVGPAFTLQSHPASSVTPSEPYSGLLEAMDEVGPQMVVVFATGRSSAAGVWGELITTACQHRDVTGAVTDGLIRDAEQLQGSGFPVFGRGTLPYDSKGRLDVTAHQVPVEVDGVRIRPGDLVVADLDGVAIVPQEIIDEVLTAIDQKRANEDAFRAAVAQGMSMRQAFQLHQVL